LRIEKDKNIFFKTNYSIIKFLLISCDTDFRHAFFLFILQGGARPPSQVLGEGARPAAPP